MPHLLRGVRVLQSAGLIEMGRPRQLLYASRATRSLGAIAGACAASARRDPDRAAIIDDEGATTYAELDARTTALARAWLANGLSIETTVGVLCRDHRQAVEAMVAVGKLGGRLVLLNTGFSGPQLADVARREGVDVLVADADLAPQLDGLERHIPTYVAYGEVDGMPSTCDLIERESLCDAVESVPWPKTNRGFVLLTGGTTGTPKGAPRTVRSPLVAAQFLERIPMRRGDVVLVAAPIFHGTGMSQFTIAFALGCTVVLRRRFDAAGTMRAMRAHQVTMLVAVPTMLQRIVAFEEGQLRRALPSLRVILSAGAPLTAGLGERVVERFGPVLHNLYGCTEVALATIATAEDWTAAPGTVGRPPTGVVVRIVDDQDQVITRPDVSGRIFVGNPLAFDGYSGGGTKPQLEGLLGTGDLGHWDADGRLFVDGRDDDMIVSGGENVFAGEIDDLVSAMPGVVEVATIGVPDEEFGQRLRVYLVREDDHPTEDEVKEAVRVRLARFKVPREVMVVDDIPYTATGKVARGMLIKQAVRSHRSTEE
ncbi:AMP-binding protein [Luteipulveratus mongoliensis]|uniref:Acyl-CoA synthetase n=1 Tax=Luteipulveratus mongoliensis TaxID=571913 RepID=A0A0K1JNF9_9MICO|nr:AMP-binding protein [Luteipulveratus mongoliensis]AKU18231.1 acyl-CoA synthetase [Luteipulveratus mongoliensis]